MALAALFNVPKTEEELNEWAFAHMSNHRDINRVIYQILKVVLPEYALDPVDVQLNGVWQRQHQELHKIMNSITGLSGFNLLGLDWKDENKLAAWINLNAVEHRQVCNLLRLD